MLIKTLLELNSPENDRTSKEIISIVFLSYKMILGKKHEYYKCIKLLTK